MYEDTRKQLLQVAQDVAAELREADVRERELRARIKHLEDLLEVCHVRYFGEVPL